MFVEALSISQLSCCCSSHSSWAMSNKFIFKTCFSHANSPIIVFFAANTAHSNSQTCTRKVEHQLQKFHALYLGWKNDLYGDCMHFTRHSLIAQFCRESLLCLISSSFFNCVKFHVLWWHLFRFSQTAERYNAHWIEGQGEEERLHRLARGTRQRRSGEDEVFDLCRPSLTRN